MYDAVKNKKIDFVRQLLNNFLSKTAYEENKLLQGMITFFKHYEKNIWESVDPGDPLRHLAFCPYFCP